MPLQGGFTWHYRAPIFTAAAFPRTVIGPTEHDVVLLPGLQQRMMTVVRADGNGLPCWDASYYEYQHVVSDNRGLSWSAPAPVRGAGCVRPKLLSLNLAPPLVESQHHSNNDGWSVNSQATAAASATVLSGGRLCTENVSDNFLWASKGTGEADEAWRRYSLSGIHNRLWHGDKALLFSPSVNSSDASGRTLATLSYTSLLPGEERGSAVVVYSMYTTYAGVQGANVAFSMKLRLATDGDIQVKTDDHSIVGCFRALERRYTEI